LNDSNIYYIRKVRNSLSTILLESEVICFMESSKEIRKLFYQDSYEKKKIGANVFKKASAGTERAGVAGGLIFPKYNYKRYEKNSKVKERNVFKEIVDYNTFKDFSEDKQRKLL